MQTTIELADETVSLHDVVHRVMHGEEIIIAESGTPVVKLVPIATPKLGRRTAGLSEGAGTIADDFDAPLPDSFWLAGE